VAAWRACRAEAWPDGEQGLAVVQGGSLVFCGVEARVDAWGPASSFSVSWHAENFHRLGVQGAEISALPHALLQPSMSPVSQQDP
jgi:hypothetical protein